MLKFITTMTALLLLTICSLSVAQEKPNDQASANGGVVLKIKLASIIVNDQAKAEKFYTEVLGFVVKDDIPVGEYKWLTVVSPDDTLGTQLLLEPNALPPAAEFQKAIYAKGIPSTTLFVEDVQKTYEDLQKAGVVFKTPPSPYATTIVAIFDDTCGNYIQIVQE